MYEDDTYRSSSQFRLWSFTKQQLEERRQETNRLAADKVEASLKRARLGKHNATSNGLKELASSSAPASGSVTPESTPRAEAKGDVVPLNTAEELLVLQWGCETILELQENLGLQDDRIPVLCTAIQYLRRFYLASSPMSYHPKQILTCAIWLAFKSEHMPQKDLHNIDLFVSKLDKTTVDEVKAPEFLLMQSLRFTLEVRHPMRGLAGRAIDMKRLTDSSQLTIGNEKGSSLKRRIDKAHKAAKLLCMKEVQMTDAYFLYTPPQIHLACLMIVDLDLTTKYIDVLFDQLGARIGPIKQQLLDTINACAEVIRSYRSFAEDEEMGKELKRVGKKLRKCQDPEKKDIVNNEKAKLEKGYADGYDSDDTQNIKKRKNGDDGEVFGPGLAAVKAPKLQANGD